MQYPAVYPLHILQGADFYRRFVYEEGEVRVPIDISNNHLRLQVRFHKCSPQVLFEASTENGFISITEGTEGVFEMHVPAVETEKLKFQEGVYDLELIDTNGFVTRILEGSFYVDFEVTRT